MTFSVASQIPLLLDLLVVLGVWLAVAFLFVWLTGMATYRESYSVEVDWETKLRCLPGKILMGGRWV